MVTASVIIGKEVRRDRLNACTRNVEVNNIRPSSGIGLKNRSSQRTRPSVSGISNSKRRQGMCVICHYLWLDRQSCFNRSSSVFKYPVSAFLGTPCNIERSSNRSEER